MKKLFLALSVLSLVGSLYAGGACCSKGKEKAEKKACEACTEDVKCEACTAKKAEKKAE